MWHKAGVLSRFKLFTSWICSCGGEKIPSHNDYFTFLLVECMETLCSQLILLVWFMHSVMF